jgi:hypothetical protein
MQSRPLFPEHVRSLKEEKILTGMGQYAPPIVFHPTQTEPLLVHQFMAGLVAGTAPPEDSLFLTSGNHNVASSKAAVLELQDNPSRAAALSVFNVYVMRYPSLESRDEICHVLRAVRL